MILQFGWKKVSIITHNEPSFVTVSPVCLDNQTNILTVVQMMNALKWLLEANDVKYTEELFNDVNTVGDTPYVRITVTSVYLKSALFLFFRSLEQGYSFGQLILLMQNHLHVR